MIEKIKGVLSALGIQTWKVSETSKESAELFFIRKAEDMRRAKSVREFAVTVYRDFSVDDKKMRGSSAVLIQPGMTEDEISAKIGSAYSAAQYVKNPYFDLPEPHREVRQPEGELASLPLEKTAEIMADALFTPDVLDESFINSAEIFAERDAKRILTSAGTDVSFSVNRVKGEFVVQCIAPKDVEMYFDFKYDVPDTLALSALSAEALTTVRDRAEAEIAPAAGTYDLILTKKHAATVLSAYAESCDASLIYAKYSPYSIGSAVQGENVKGDILNITVFPDEPFSPDGIPMPERPLIENGKLVGIYGATRFCRYLGLEPTGSYENIRVLVGETPLDEMKARPYLMPIAFSDFQMDAFSKRFGGEIRLAYLFDGNTVKLVTGGSVSGSLLEKQGELTFSKERYADSAYDGPYAIRIPGVSVAGS